VRILFFLSFNSAEAPCLNVAEGNDDLYSALTRRLESPTSSGDASSGEEVLQAATTLASFASVFGRSHQQNEGGMIGGGDAGVRAFPISDENATGDGAEKMMEETCETEDEDDDSYRLIICE